MANSCGIDLGTTNSCLALAGDDQPQVVCDDLGRKTVPSVVFGDAKGATTVGHAAKNRMGALPPPIITIKRKMGTDERVRLGDRMLGAVEVSTIILQHLKEMGERANGGSLENVVVTVPAYFSHRQKQETEAAAEGAGFKRVVVLQEPVAAALAYCVNSGSDDPMIVLAYDLGGGTFDATVLERTSDGEITVLAFGGDKWLGGDDFDSLLAEHVRARLASNGYALDWNLESQEHYAKFQKLKRLCENAKIELSTSGEVPLNFPGIFLDEVGESVDLDMVVARNDLYQLIEDRLEESIRLTAETLERSRVPASKLSQLIMVGGSSHIPRVRERLRETFGLDPVLVDPETVVAVGAAIKAAASFGRRVDGREIAVDLDYPAATKREKVRISGKLSRAVSGWRAVLCRGEWESSQELGGRAGFRFDEVSLEPGEKNEFALTLEDEHGEEALLAEIAILRDEAITTMRAPEALVAKPIAIRTVSGLETLIESGARLPVTVKRIFATQDQSGSIRVPIYEGSVQIGEVRMSEVPRELPIGSPVEVEISFREDYRVSASALIQDTERRTDAKFDLPAVRVPGRDEVATRQVELRERWGAALAAGATRDRDAFETLRRQIDQELEAPEPKLAKIAEDLSELELLVLSAEAERLALQMLQPPLSEVERRLGDAEKRAAEEGSLQGSFGVDEFRKRVADVRAQASACWQRRDLAGWRDVVSSLSALERLVAPGFDLDKLPRNEARDLAVSVALFLQEESGRDPRARAQLAGTDLQRLALSAIEEPYDAARRGLSLLRQLVNAGITVLPGASQAPAGPTPVPEIGDLRGLLGRVRA